MYLDLDELKLEQVGTGGVNEHGREELCIWLHLKKKTHTDVIDNMHFSFTTTSAAHPDPRRPPSVRF